MILQMILIQLEIPVMVTSAIKRTHNTIWELNKGLGRGIRERYISFSSLTRSKLAYRHCFKESIQSIDSQKSHFFKFN